MKTRTLAGFQVSVLGLGTSRLASLGARRSKSDARRLLAAASDLGITFIDTADTYGSTAAERWLGELLADRPDDFVVATKSGLPTADLPGPLRVANQPVKKLLQRRGRPVPYTADRLRGSIDASLCRLRRERIELYFLHLPPLGIERSQEVFSTLEEARAAGKIGAFGVATNEFATIRALRAAGLAQCVQTAVNASSRTAVEGLQAEDEVPVDLVANHVMGGLSLGDPAGALRLAAEVPGVKVVLTGTSDVAHLRANAEALRDF